MTDSLGRLLVFAGLVVVGAGALLWAGGSVLPLGRLPGDILIRRGSFTFYFPLASGLVLSLLLTLLLNLIFRIRIR